MRSEAQGAAFFWDAITFARNVGVAVGTTSLEVLAGGRAHRLGHRTPDRTGRRGAQQPPTAGPQACRAHPGCRQDPRGPQRARP